MKITIDQFRADRVQPVETPLDFAELRTLLERHQAATATAQLARDAASDPSDHGNPAIAVLLAGPGQQPIKTPNGSFHAAAAARFSEERR